jgi:hypothetical protein
MEHVTTGDLFAVWRSRFGDAALGHEHFWQRALSRREVIRGALIGAGAALAWPGVASAKPAAVLPNPILGGTLLPGSSTKRGFYFPTLVNPVGSTEVVADGTGDASTIRDFRGIVGLAEFPATGAVHDDPLGGHFWAADFRFMQGQFIGTDGHTHHGTFAFI